MEASTVIDVRWFHRSRPPCAATALSSKSFISAPVACSTSLRHAARWVSQRQYGGSEWLKLIAHTAAVGLSSRLLGHGIVAVVVCGR
jgi:hypothetical protein